MEIQEKKLGRVFRLKFVRGENFFDTLHKFAREKQIKEASLFVLGAFEEGRMITGFRSAGGYDVSRRPLGQKREFFALGTLTWPAKPPAAVEEDIPWDKPQPYAHIHLAMGPDVGEEQKETLVGHLSKMLSFGGFVYLYELL